MMVGYLEKFLAMKSHNSLTTWSCEIEWEIKTIILHYLSAYGDETWQGSDLS